MYYINFIRNIMLLLMLPILTSCSTTYTYNPAIISAGQNHTMAIKEDGTLWGWGSDEAGQLGLGNNEEHIIINWSTDYLKICASISCKNYVRCERRRFRLDRNSGDQKRSDIMGMGCKSVWTIRQWVAIRLRVQVY